jgi:hypothetical protein
MARSLSEAVGGLKFMAKVPPPITSGGKKIMTEKRADLILLEKPHNLLAQASSGANIVLF